MNDLNDRQRFALRWLAAQGKADLVTGNVRAWALGDAMNRAGFFLDGGRLFSDTANGKARSASRTLSSLARRGLAVQSTPGGEAFQSVLWSITDEGLALLEPDVDGAGRTPEMYR